MATEAGRNVLNPSGRRVSRVRAPPVVAARKPRPSDRLLERADDEAAHEGRIAEAHLGLGRVDVHVHGRGSRSIVSASTG